MQREEGKRGLIDTLKGTVEEMDVKGTAEQIGVKGKAEQIDVEGMVERTDVEGTAERIVVEGTTESMDVQGTTESMGVVGTAERIDVKGTAKVIDETIDMISVEGHVIPHVQIELEGLPVRFVVDTGCQCSSITKRQMKILGYEATDLEVTGDAPCRTLGHLLLDVKINAYEMRKSFIVNDSFVYNLLGLDILATYCCIIDLDKNTLTLREYNEDASWDIPKTTVTVQGKDVEMEIDTGCESCTSGPLSLAKELDLSLKPAHGRSVLGVGYEVAVPYVATDLCIEAFGRRMSNAWYTVKPDETPEEHKDPILGVVFFSGLRLQFNPDGTFGVTGPRQEDQVGRSAEPREEGEAATTTTEEPLGFDEGPTATATSEKTQESDEELAASAVTEEPHESN